jgi:RHS repeat-associated protein
MTGAVEKTSGGTVLAQATYTYDALGNRIGMDENGTQTWTLYDGGTPIMDFNGSGSLEMRYLNGPAGDLVDTVLARQSASGTVAWYLPDRLGTIRDLINNSGSIIDHVDYSAFGTQLDESSPSNGDRMMGFAGMERDTATGQNLAMERVENPVTGRWTSQDPLGFAGGGTNLYLYSENSAVNEADPLGLEPTQSEAFDPQKLVNYIRQLEKQGMNAEQIFAKIEEDDGVVPTCGGRYFYTDKWGWVDLRHLAASASWGYWARDSDFPQFLGFGLEVHQMLHFWDNDSWFSYEDMPSNAAGGNFGKWAFYNYYRSDGPYHGDLAGFLEKWLKYAHARPPGDPATGCSNLPRGAGGGSPPRGINPSPGPSPPVKSPPPTRSPKW